MKSDNHTPSSINDYIAGFPENTRKILEVLHNVIKKAVPGAIEKMSYRMPTYALHGNLVHFASYKNHIGFYPNPSGIEAFKEELSAYKWSKGAVQFPVDKPLPLDLIRRIVEFRVKENIEKAG